MPGVDDYYCIKVIRYGAAGVQEASFHDHAITRQQLDIVLASHLNTLGPGDKAQVTLTRGLQREPPE